MSWKFLIRSRLSYLARMQRMSPYTDSTPNESIVMWEKIGLWSWIEPLLNNVESFSEMVFKCLKSFSAENTRFWLCASRWRRQFCTGWIDVVMEVQEKETLAMFKAMKWVEQLPFSVVIFESDCKGLVNQVKSRNNSTTEF
ncbi:hypothetical protein JHK85_033488 [Glycine max]|uniref:RNase H type-1 domain-containing protein n=1 Tax=Glycine max TaxID=3847 RepID=A0A0R0HAQ0_SOYBN|nr:hypothetical protein JHK85_033488 [Glycine max]KAG4985181.1 hypothetical protein JHK86_032872 [Glycine max]